MPVAPLGADWLVGGLHEVLPALMRSLQGGHNKGKLSCTLPNPLIHPPPLPSFLSEPNTGITLGASVKLMMSSWFGRKWSMIDAAVQVGGRAWWGGTPCVFMPDVSWEPVP